MRILRAWLVRVASVVGRKRSDHELAEEIASHIQLDIEEGVREGLLPEEARRRALIRFGGVEASREAWRNRRGIPFVETLWKDVAYAFRMMGRTKGWTAVAVLSLALGIGANTALFSVIHAVLIDELPVESPGEIVAFRWAGPNNVAGMTASWGSVNAAGEEPSDASFSTAAIEAFQDANRTFSDIFAVAPTQPVNLVVDGTADVATSEFVTGNYFRGLGVAAAAGRLLTPEDDDAGADPVVVISHGYWTGRFGRDPGIVGRTVSLNGVGATIVGVAPSGLGSIRRIGRDSADLALPLSMEARLRPEFPLSARPDAWWLLVMGRLNPGATLDGARANLEPAFRQIAFETGDAQRATLPAGQLERLDPVEVPRLVLVPGNRGIYDVPGQVEQPLSILAGVFGIVLIIVSVNVANLMLSRAESRHQEITVRMAIGASRGRLLGQWLTESVVLAAVGGAAGLAVAYATRQTFHAFGETFGLVALDAVDPATLGFAAGISFLTGLVFGIAPAWRASRHHDEKAVYAAGHRARGPQSWLGQSLVVIQVSLSLILVVGASLFLRTLVNLQAVDTGFNSENLALFRIDPGFGGYDADEAATVFDRILERLEATPVVRAASIAGYTLLSGTSGGSGITLEGSESSSVVSTMTVHHAFFETMEIPVVLGRVFSPADDRNSPPVAVINETAARELFPDSNPLGRRFQGEFLYEIVGVVADTKYTNVRNAPPRLVFFADGQAPGSGGRTFLVRTTGNPETAFPAIRDAVRQVDAGLPLLDVTTQRANQERLLRRERMFASASAVFGGLALVVAAIGLFGLMSYAVTRRTREIGIRMALGAGERRVLGGILRESFALVAIGVVLGLGGAMAATRFIESLLFGLAPDDPATIAVAVAVMLGATAVSAYVPARRASRVNPIVALRHE